MSCKVLPTELRDLPLKAIRDIIHYRTLNYRSIDRFINKEVFENVFLNMDPSTRNQVTAALLDANLDRVLGIIKSIHELPFDTMTTVQLKALAQSYCITNWSRLPKRLLIKELEKCQSHV